MSKKDDSSDSRRSTIGRSSKGRLSRPKGSAAQKAAEPTRSRQGQSAKANSHVNHSVGGAPTGVEEDPIIARAIRAVEQDADKVGVELSGKVTIRKINKSYVVRAGRTQLGRLTQDQLVRCDFGHLLNISRSVWIDVVRLGGDVSWADWAGPLRAAQWALGRLMDAAIDELRLAQRYKTKTPLATLAYRIITSEEEQQKLRDLAAKFAVRAKVPKGKKSKWAYRSEFSLSGAACSVASQTVHQFFQRWEKEEIGYPSWSGPGGSIPLRAQELRIKQTKDGILLRFSVRGGRGNHHECYVSPKGGSAWAQVRNILSGEWDYGNGRLVWNNRRRCWRVSLSYRRPRAAKAGGGGCFVVRRSAQDMLFVMSDKGRTLRDARGIGLQIIHAKKYYTARKSKLRSILNAQGRGARGHGKNRFYRPYSRLFDKEKRVVDSKLKQLASAIRREAQHAGASTVHVEDFSLRWFVDSKDDSFVRLLMRMPWAQAEQILKTELEEHGIKFNKAFNAHDMAHCPDCGSESIEFDGKYLDCPDCGMLVQRPAAAGWNMLKTVEADTEELTKHMRTVAKQLRKFRKGRDNPELVDGSQKERGDEETV